MKLLAISGSLRAGASNTALLEAAALVAPPGVEVTLYESLAALPAFNPDLDEPTEVALPAGPADLRKRVGEADGLLISSPEYAHGIPGVLKNALDWLVGSLTFPGKPVAVLEASSYSVHARAQLIEVLTTMTAHLVPEASVTVTLPRGSRLDGKTVAANAEHAAILRRALTAFAHSIETRKANGE